MKILLSSADKKNESDEIRKGIGGMRVVGSEVLPNLIRPESYAQEGNEVHRGASRQTLRHTLASTADHVELSGQAREAQRLQQLVQDTPEMRETRVIEVQRALSEKSLPLDGHILAPKLIVEAISTATHRAACSNGAP
jgi:hypothetical protein